MILYVERAAEQSMFETLDYNLKRELFGIEIFLSAFHYYGLILFVARIDRQKVNIELWSHSVI